MITAAKEIYSKIHDEVQKLPLNEFMLSPDEQNSLRSEKVSQLIQIETQAYDENVKARVLDELHSWGPLCSLIEDESITEIIVNGPHSIWYEKHGKLLQHQDTFFSELSFRNMLDRMCHEARTHISTEHPCADGAFKDFRLSLIGAEVTRSHSVLTLRRHPKNPWTFERLQSEGWCSEEHLPFFEKMIAERKNFLVIGPTGAGKTSVLNSFLRLLPENERLVLVEDTPEISLSNAASIKLLTREDAQGVLPAIDQTQLVKRTLRLRPDRIAMGEVRGAEAKDFLMALATGHAGSFGTLHAQAESD